VCPPLRRCCWAGSAAHNARSLHGSLTRRCPRLPAPPLPTPLLPARAGQAPACTYSFGNSSFNLGLLKLSGSFYHVEDDRNNYDSMNYTYFFNVCDNIDYNASYFPYTADCYSTTPGPGGGSSIISGPAPAFQYANVPVPVGDKCHKLGGDVRANPGNMQWGLYDVNNPSAGVVLQVRRREGGRAWRGRLRTDEVAAASRCVCDPTAHRVSPARPPCARSFSPSALFLAVLQYTGGDPCPNSGGKSRSLKLWLNCYNDQGCVLYSQAGRPSSLGSSHARGVSFIPSAPAHPPSPPLPLPILHPRRAPHRPRSSVPTNENVLESEMCTYDIFVNSALGCPAECPLVPAADGQSKWLCAKHGVVSRWRRHVRRRWACAAARSLYARPVLTAASPRVFPVPRPRAPQCDYDPEIRSSRCFCNEGWAGGDCSQVATSPPGGLSAVGAVLLTVSLLLVATLVFL
jgi:hypothetical protein